LVYPDWFAGTWTMTSTLVDAIAPLAPDLVTPWFADNQTFLHKPIDAVVRFVPARVVGGKFLAKPLQVLQKIVGDRAFNGLSLAKAYLGNGVVQSVKVDPKNPNRQITKITLGCDRPSFRSTFVARVYLNRTVSTDFSRLGRVDLSQ
jgi:hypothetical protein